MTIANGKALGAMTGWGFVAMGTTDTVSDPTCGTGKTAITATTACATSTNWSSTTALCVTGSVPIADTAYASWGLSVGVNSSATAGGGLGQAFTSMAVTVTGTPSTGLRVQVHRAGDADSISYCVDSYTSGTATPLTSFITDCYNGTSAKGTKITSASTTTLTLTRLASRSRPTRRRPLP